MSRTIARDRGRLVRLVAMVLITLYGRRVNTLRSEVEEGCHSAAFANVDANQRRQVGFTALMVVVFGLGAAGMAVVAWRRRSAMAQAYEALLGEVGERRAAQEAHRANEGRFRSLALIIHGGCRLGSGSGFGDLHLRF